MGSNGTYARYISIPELIAAKIPEGISFEETAAIPIAYLTALQTFSRLPLKKDDAVFISGTAGSVGLALTKLLLAAGNTRIIGTAGNPESKEQIIRAGLPEKQVINYVQQNLASVIISTNDGFQFHHCIDAVGGAMSEICGQVIKTNGNYADITALTNATAREELFNKGAVIVNISNYAYSLNGNITYYGNGLNQIADLLINNSITPPPLNIVRRLSVETVTIAHQMLENNQSKGRKLVMRV
jgi:NADPH2:quinone reductase